MRELDECKAEILRRSENRIKERRRKRIRVLALCIPLCMALTVLTVVLLPANSPAWYGNTLGGVISTDEDHELVDCSLDVGDNGYLDGFSFSLTWGCYGISSYDSASGKLVKTTDASVPEDYVTYCNLDTGDMKRIRELLLWLDVSDYPDNYDPQNNGLASEPSMTLVLTVKTADTERTVKAENIALSYEADNPKGQRFLNVCKEIIDIITDTEEWKALPDYEFFYD